MLLNKIYLKYNEKNVYLISLNTLLCDIKIYLKYNEKKKKN